MPVTGTRTRHALLATALGELTATVADDALTAVYFPGHWHLPAGLDLGEPVEAADDPVLAALDQQLAEYLGGDRREFDLPVRLSGDPFQLRVWELLDQIPYGSTTTYGALADRLGGRALAQRVGQAVAWNPVSIVVPCHRVVGADGSLTGYAGGLDRKRRLLELEEPAEVAAGRLF